MPRIAKTEKLTEGRVRMLNLWRTDEAYIIADTGVVGLHLRIGLKRKTWHFYNERRLHGERIVTSERLGHLPDMTLAKARKAAKVIAGRIASGRVTPGKRSAAKFADAMTEYLGHLVRQSERRGKPARWAGKVRSLSRLYLIPPWGKWPLAGMSGSPAAVRDWHAKVTRDAGPTTANRCVQVMRACYKHASRLNRSLPVALPTSAVIMNPEKPSERALAFSDFPAWSAAWSEIKSPVRRAYHLTALLCGARPGELARLKWSDVHPRERCFVVTNAKAGADISIILSIPIVRALKMARDASKPGEFVFPGLNDFDGRDAGLPAKGNVLRHSYRSVCADLEIDELLTHLLMGHALEGVSRKYISKLVVMNGPGLRRAQVQISRRIVRLLGLTL
jgi:integrase